MFRGMWEIVETEAEKTSVVKTKGRRKEKRMKRTKKEENNGSKEGGRRIENLGWEGESSKVTGKLVSQRFHK